MADPGLGRAAQSKRPTDSAFKQQTLNAWRPVLSPKLVVVLFAAVGVIFLPIGIAIIVASNDVVEVETRDYGGTSSPDNEEGGCCIRNCDGHPWEREELNPCNITFEVTERMSPPIFMYYRLTNYYQNHRRYVRSRDDAQLVGDDTMSESDLSESCEYHYSAPWDNNAIINPCGLIAWSMFNDSYALFRPDGSPVSLDTRSIAWQSDLDTKFRNAQDGTSGQNFPPFAFWRAIDCTDNPDVDGVNPPTAADRQLCETENTRTPGVGWCFRGSGYCTEDQHFVVWMRSAGLPTFRKLFARIEEALEPGMYTVMISNGVNTFKNATTGDVTHPQSAGNPQFFNYGTPLTSPFPPAEPTLQTFLYPVQSFGGTKRVVLSTISWIGGRNFFLGYAYLVVGIICIVLAICFFVKWQTSSRDLGSASWITNNANAAPK